jgi:transcriptional regulator with XRE-family HTH domain
MVERHQRPTIRTLRRRAGWSQQELADLLGVAKMTVSHWETGRNEPSARQLLALARVFALAAESIGFERELALQERGKQ